MEHYIQYYFSLDNKTVVNNSVVQFPFTADFKESQFAFRPENTSLPLQAYTTFLKTNNYTTSSDIDRIVAQHVSIYQNLLSFNFY